MTPSTRVASVRRGRGWSLFRFRAGSDTIVAATASSRDRVAGRTEHNKLGLFTGWEDASLAKEGIAEAKRAGQLLRAHGFAVDAVYTSWLSRAIETAWLALQELDALWVPIIKSWRLNERMYGALTGLSKKAILGEHGAASASSLNLPG